jgi:hypothetical protein
MGQIIRLPILEYPTSTADLDPAECVLLIAVRWWVAVEQPWRHPAALETIRR